jgi:hypothetical protein
VILPASQVQSSGFQTMSYVIRGLEPGQNYEAKVQARNKFGWSPISEAFTFQTTDTDLTFPERPQSPRHVYNENEIKDLGIRIYSGSADTVSKAATTLCIIYSLLTALN